MRKHIAGLLVIALLSGCASPRLAGNDDFAPKRATEEAGWTRLGALSGDKCGASALPPEKGRAVALSNCVTGLVRVYVLPKAAFPDLVLSSRAEALRIASDYDEGKISPEEYKAQSEERLKSYSDSVASLANQKTPLRLADR